GTPRALHGERRRGHDRMTPAAEAPRRASKWALRLSRSMLEALLVLACAVLAVAAPGFLSVENLMGVLRSVSEIGIIAFGMTMVIIAGEIDLSVGSSAAFAGCLLAWLAKHHFPIPIALLLTVLVGAAFGAFTGAMRGRFAVPSFITTLALFTGLRGLA